MQLQFGIFDYIIIAIFYGLAGTVLILARLFLRRWKYWSAVIFPLAVVAVVLPWADEVWIAWHFNQLCKEAGVHVLRPVRVPGFYDATMRSGYELIEKEGFQVMEQPSRDGRKIDHVEKKDGAWRTTTLDQPSARYHYKYSDPRQEVPIGYRLEKREVVVIDSETGEVLGRETRFNRYPAWIQSLWIKYFGNGGSTCEGTAPQPPTSRHLLYHYVLIPRTMAE